MYLQLGFSCCSDLTRTLLMHLSGEGRRTANKTKETILIPIFIMATRVSTLREVRHILHNRSCSKSHDFQMVFAVTLIKLHLFLKKVS